MSSSSKQTKNWVKQSVIQAHDSDIRCVNFIKSRPNYILTGSRDKKCHLYDISNGQLLAILSGHDHYVQTLHNDSEFIYTGSTDKFLRKYALSNLFSAVESAVSANSFPINIDNPSQILEDHTEAIVSIDTSDKFIATASWDKLVKIWRKDREKSSLTLTGHEAAVWSVKIVKNDYVLSASADKNIILWSLKQKGAQLITYAGHSDCVRSLCVFNPISDDYFYSTGNDGTIKLWNTETGEMITSVQAHANYCYSISGRKTDKTTFSCGEDASLLIYNPETNFTKNFELPCISAWSCDNNEKFAAVGTNRGELFCFTDDASLAVELAEQDFEKAVAQFKAKKEAAEQAKTENTENGLSEDELKKIPGPEVLENPGPKENFVQMVRPNANSKQVDVHQWTGGKWVLIGQAMGSNNSKDSKKLHDDGKYYDRIFEVNADTRPGQALKLPYNYTQNPWEAAQKFIETNNLAIEELEVVANFIIENIPEDKRKIYLDAESSGLNSKSSATAHGDDQPETDQLKPLNHFPETTNVAFDSVPPMDKVLVLIKNSFGESILSRQYENIMDYKVLSEIFLNGEVTDKVGSEKIFPLLDLLRLSIFQMDASQLSLNNQQNLKNLTNLLQTLVATYGASNPKNTMLITKILNNLIIKLEKSHLSTTSNFLSNTVLNFVNFNLLNSKDPKILLASVTLLLNFSINLNEFWQNSLAETLDVEVISSVLNVLNLESLSVDNLSANVKENLQTEQIVLRILILLGNLLYYTTVKQDESSFEMIKCLCQSSEKFGNILTNYASHKNSSYVGISSEISGFLE